MAEVLFRRKLSREGLADGWVVESAATWGAGGQRATQLARDVAAENGLNLDSHRSQRVDNLEMDSFDLILAMQAGHQEALRAEFPDLADRVQLLSAMAGPAYGVKDPAGGNLETYQQTWQEIERLIEEGFEEIVRAADSR
jgi:protein-tyrosine phosphatase